LTARAEREIQNLVGKYLKTTSIWIKMKDDPYLQGLWEMSDYLLKTKMHFNAHGDTHAKVVAANAIKMFDVLVRKGVEIDTVHDGIGDIDDAFLIILASALLHDIGNAIQREKHYNHSVILAIPMLGRLLPEIYKDPMKLAQIRGSILYCIGTHMEDVKSYTLEASILKIADGTDIAKGRSRLDYDPACMHEKEYQIKDAGSIIVKCTRRLCIS
jgi:metal-dependent HD superfamily phosphatase/phosphodiesterase